MSRGEIITTCVDGRMLESLMDWGGGFQALGGGWGLGRGYVGVWVQRRVISYLLACVAAAGYDGDSTDFEDWVLS